MWKRYWKWIAVGASVVLIQALLIARLLANLIQRRRAEVSLAESEKRFQATADAAPVLMWMTGEDKLCTYLNKAWVAFTGRNAELDLGNGWRQIIHADDMGKLVQTYESAFDARQPFMIQYRLRRHDGEYRWITAQGVPRHGPNGHFRGYVGACVDISDLLNKETALRESEERIALATEAARVGAWELKPATSEFWVSDKLRELFGFGPEEVVTYEDFRQRVHPEDRAESDALFEQAINQCGRYEMEFRIVLPDGTLRWMAGRAHCANDGAGCRLLGVAVDVTKRREAEELFRLVTEASPSGTLLVDDKGRIQLINAHVEELFGYERAELINEPIEMLIPDRVWAAHPDLRDRFLADPKDRELRTGWELVARRKDRSEFPVEVGLNPIETPQGFRVLASVVDISARKAAEEEARHHREQINLLSRVSLLGEMTASLAHELNQPLSAIISNANAGVRSIDKGKEDAGMLREIFVDMEADGRRAHGIIQDVRNTIKKGNPTRHRINLNELVTKVAHIVRPDAVAYCCEIEVSLAEDLPLIEVDPIQIQQVLVNLVSNAFDAMRQTPPDQRKVRA